MKGKYLITTDNWFFCPNGNSYKAVWGNVEIFNDEKVLGIQTNRQSSNWYAKVGSEEKHIIIAGCQIHYSIHCNEQPDLQPVEVENVYEGKIMLAKSQSRIYIAE